MGKKKALKLPKKIAGVRIPKAFRKSGGSLLKFLETPQGREIAASVLFAVAGALTGNEKTRQKVSDAGHEAARVGSDVTRNLAEAAAGMVVDVARNMRSSRGADRKERADRGEEPAATDQPKSGDDRLPRH
jgi:hypothetical protein